MLKVAITGQMGSGKSYIANIFESIGVPYISMDLIAKEVQSKYVDLQAKLRNRFPDGYKSNGELDKESMRRILFFDKTGKNLKDMYDLFLPYLFKDLDEFYNRNLDKAYVLVESALIYEYDLQKLFDLIIFVDADEDIRRERALKRDGISREDYDNRMKNQIPDEYKIKHSDFVIRNDFTDNIRSQVINLNSLLLDEKHTKILK